MERLNQTIKNLLQVGIKDGFQWKENLSNVLLPIRSTPHSTMKETPFRLMTDRDMRVKLSTLQPPNLQGKKLQRTDVVRKAVEKVQRKSKERFDGKASVKKNRFTESDLVRTKLPLQKRWKADIQNIRGLKELCSPPLQLWMGENGTLAELCHMRKTIILFHGSIKYLCYEVHLLISRSGVSHVPLVHLAFSHVISVLLHKTCFILS